MFADTLTKKLFAFAAVTISEKEEDGFYHDSNINATTSFTRVLVSIIFPLITRL